MYTFVPNTKEGEEKPEPIEISTDEESAAVEAAKKMPTGRLYKRKMPEPGRSWKGQMEEVQL